MKIGKFEEEYKCKMINHFSYCCFKIIERWQNKYAKISSGENALLELKKLQGMAIKILAMFRIQLKNLKKMEVTILNIEASRKNNNCMIKAKEKYLLFYL